MRVCSIDIGSNSVRSMVAEITTDGNTVPLLRLRNMTRLSEGMERNRSISLQAAERTLLAIRRHIARARNLGADRFISFATQVMREAENAADVLKLFECETGQNIKILSGEEEALWTYAGVISSLDIKEDCLIVDIGGGSTELVSGRLNEKPLPRSLDIGCVKLTERFIHSDPPSPPEIRSASGFISDTLRRGSPPIAGFTGRMIGTGGTITAAAALSLGLERYDPDRIHGYCMSFPEIREITARLASLPLKRRKRVAGLEEKRADIIVAGLLILEGIMEFSGWDRITVSDRGILFGAIQHLISSG